MRRKSTKSNEELKRKEKVGEYERKRVEKPGPAEQTCCTLSREVGVVGGGGFLALQVWHFINSIIGNAIN